jgi:hypothetical protein
MLRDLLWNLHDLNERLRNVASLQRGVMILKRVGENFELTLLFAAPSPPLGLITAESILSAD